MYALVPLTFPGRVDDDDVTMLVDTVLDPDRDEVARIVSAHRLRALAKGIEARERERRHDVARRLVVALNEPLLWLGSERHACLCALDDTLAVGVDARGRIVASPEAEGSLERDADGQRHCPTVGPVEALAHVGGLRARLAAPPSWLAAPPSGGALFTVFHDDGRFLRKLWVQGECTLGAGSYTARFPGRSKASMAVSFDEGRAFIRKGYAGPGPTRNGGPRIDDGTDEVRVGDRIGLDPWELRVAALVPVVVDVKTKSVVNVAITVDEQHVHSTRLAVGEAFARADRFPGHLVRLDDERVALVANGGCAAEVVTLALNGLPFEPWAALGGDTRVLVTRHTLLHEEPAAGHDVW
jgi:hypothetical protein